MRCETPSWSRNERVRNVSPRVAMALSRPSFEANAIRRWLEGAGARLEVHTRLSRGIVRSEGVGVDAAPAPPAVLEDLEELDLLIIDDGQVADFAASERDRIEGAVRRGLGVLILGGPALLDVDDLWGLSVTDRSGAELRTTLRSPAQAVTRHPLGLRGDGTVPLVRAGTGEALVAAVRHGLGAVAVTLIADSHAWEGQGDRAVFAGLWSGVLEQVLRRRGAESRLRSLDGLTTVGERIEACAGEVGCRSRVVEESGWTTFEDTVEARFIYPRDAWRTRQALDRQAATLRAAHRGIPADSAAPRVPWIDPATLWLVALGALSALWLVQKLQR